METQENGSTVTAAASSEETKQDMVAYETHKRLLGQRKSDQARLQELSGKIAELEANAASAESADLERKGELQKLLEIRTQEISDRDEKMAALIAERDEASKSVSDMFKLNAFYDKLPGKISDNSYLGFVDLDSISYDAETHEVDSNSVQEVVNKFMEKHSRLVDAQEIAKLPNQAATVSAIGTTKPTTKAEFGDALKAELTKTLT